MLMDIILACVFVKLEIIAARIMRKTIISVTKSVVLCDTHAFKVWCVSDLCVFRSHVSSPKLPQILKLQWNPRTVS